LAARHRLLATPLAAALAAGLLLIACEPANRPGSDAGSADESAGRADSVPPSTSAYHGRAAGGKTAGGRAAGGTASGDTQPAAASDAARIHPAFAFTTAEAHALVAQLQEPSARAAQEDLIGFLDGIHALLELPESQTVLVDKEHALPADYVPAELVELDSFADRLELSRPGHRLTRTTTDALLEMSDAAAAEGITLVVSSTYRSYDYQADLFQRWVDELGEQEASRVSARAGTSQHQLGTTIDFGCICDEFADQPAGRWLAQNAGRFGFSLSYPDGYERITGYSYEPWHFRYIGAEAARIEEHYFAGIQQWMLEFLHEQRAVLEGARG
jgi:D-alanyl-D-alanine carboxypeptidase